MLVKKKTLDKTPVIDTPKKEDTLNRTVFRPDTLLRHEGDSMRDLFFIVKGQYKKGVEPSFINSVTGDVSHVGGYNPYNDDTTNWYMCLDKMTFYCVACGSDFNKVLHSVYSQIMKFKGSAKKYFKHVCKVTSDDYYEVTYLGHKPLSPDQRSKKAEGRCPRVSPPMRCLYNAIYTYYGEYFSDEVAEMEDQAYKDLEEVLRDSKPINKTRKILKKAGGIKKTCGETPSKEKEVIEERPHKLVRPVNSGVKLKKIKKLGKK